jgi:hypothetical protein
MQLDDMKDAWTNIGQTPGGASLDELTAGLRRMRRIVFWRDAREILAAAVVSPIFVWAGWGFQSVGAPLAARLAVALILAGMLLIVAVLLWARHPRASVGSSVGEHLRAELTCVDRQIWILHNVAWWYVGPVLVGVNLLVATARGATSMFAIAYLVVTLAASVLIVWLNRWGARGLRPLRDSVLRSLEDVREPQTER